MLRTLKDFEKCTTGGTEGGIGNTKDFDFEISPALYAMCKSGAQTVPVIGVASSSWR